MQLFTKRIYNFLILYMEVELSQIQSLIMIMCSVNVSAHLMCREWHAITMAKFSHLLTTTVVSTAPNTRVQLTHLSNLTLLYREYDDI